MSIDHYCKINDKTLHLLPFVASRKRQKGFEIERQWGKWKLNLSAPETMNTIELITLSQMLQDYQRSPDLWGDGGRVGNVKVLERVLNIGDMVKSRGLQNKKGNRETVFKSIYRWYKAELKYTNLKSDEEHLTRYIFDIKNHNPKNIGDVTIYVSKGFLDFCLKSGLMFNWKRLLLYKTGHAQLLDAFLQGIREKRKNDGKEVTYRYRDACSEEILFNGIGLSDTDMNLREQRRILKETFKEVHEIGNLPKYTFDVVYKMWRRVDSSIVSE
jgi:hypothetical protein